MRLPLFEKYWRMTGMIGVFLAGMMVGAAVLNSLSVAKFEAIYNTNSSLREKIEQYEKDLHSLNQYKSQHTVIKSIQIRLEEGTAAQERAPLDKSSETILLRLLKEDLSIFVGRSIYDIDSDAKLARLLLERKTYMDINGKDYSADLKTVLLAENVLQIWVQAKRVIKPPST